MSKILIPKNNFPGGVIVNPQSGNVYRHVLSFEDEDIKAKWIGLNLFDDENFDYRTEIDNGIEKPFTIINDLNGQVSINTSNELTLQRLLSVDFLIIKEADNIYFYSVIDNDRTTEQNNTTVTLSLEIDIFFTYDVKTLFNDNKIMIERAHINRYDLLFTPNRDQQIKNEFFDEQVTTYTDDVDGLEVEYSTEAVEPSAGNRNNINGSLNAGVWWEIYVMRNPDDTVPDGNGNNLDPRISFGDITMPYQVYLAPSDNPVKIQNPDTIFKPKWDFKTLYDKLIKSGLNIIGVIPKQSYPLGSNNSYTTGAGGAFNNAGDIIIPQNIGLRFDADIGEYYIYNAKENQSSVPLATKIIDKTISGVDKFAYIDPYHVVTSDEYEYFEPILTRAPYTEYYLKNFTEYQRIDLFRLLNEGEHNNYSFFVYSSFDSEVSEELFILKNSKENLIDYSVNSNYVGSLPVSVDKEADYVANNRASYLNDKFKLGLPSISGLSQGVFSGGGPLNMFESTFNKDFYIGNQDRKNANALVKNNNAISMLIIKKFYSGGFQLITARPRPNEFKTLFDYFQQKGVSLNTFENINDYLKTRYWWNYIQAPKSYEIIKLPLSTKMKLIIDSSINEGITIWNVRSDNYNEITPSFYKYNNTEMIHIP